MHPRRPKTPSLRRTIVERIERIEEEIEELNEGKREILSSRPRVMASM